MKGSLLVLSMFFVGCVLGYVWNFSGWELGRYAPLVHVYSVCPDVSGRCQHWRGRGFQGTASWFPSQDAADTAGHHARRNPAVFGIGECAVDPLECVRLSWPWAAELGYYSLSSILIMELKTPDLGAQLATELATIALGRGRMLSASWWHWWELLSSANTSGNWLLYSVAGVTSVDVALPSIIRVSGKEMVPLCRVSMDCWSTCPCRF